GVAVGAVSAPCAGRGEGGRPRGAPPQGGGGPAPREAQSRSAAPAVAAAAVMFAFAAAAPAGAGQPNADCENDVPSNPPPGFSTAGFEFATTMYAGADNNPATNPHAVSQYDVACVSGRTR